jgi:hypothetical protein
MDVTDQFTRIVEFFDVSENPQVQPCFHRREGDVGRVNDDPGLPFFMG